jgi:hypothetical protein
MADRAYLDALSRRLADEGKLIQAGWTALRAVAPLTNKPAAEIDMLRLAYLAGAQHTFASMFSFLYPGSDATPTDMRRMELIANEMEAIRRELELRFGKSRGSA